MNFPDQAFNLLSYFLKQDITKWPEVETKLETALNESKKTASYVTIYHDFQKLQLGMNVQMDSECKIAYSIQKLKKIGVSV